jgi:hypothetical protein
MQNTLFDLHPVSTNTNFDRSFVILMFDVAALSAKVDEMEPFSTPSFNLLISLTMLTWSLSCTLTWQVGGALDKMELKLDNRLCFSFNAIALLFSFSFSMLSSPGSCQTAGFDFPA